MIRRKKIIKVILITLLVLVVILTGAGFYILNYSLSPDDGRAEVDSAFVRLYENYPESQAWVDSLKEIHALRDTFAVMPSGERHHAYYINNGSRSTALVLHGWRDSAIKYLFLARIYDKELGYNIVLPDIYAHGQSDGDVIRMGWLDRLDMVRWLKMFPHDTVVVHGVSMGGATAMMMSGDPVPDGVKDIRFVADCGYTSVWDEFKGELKNQFGLPSFPLLDAASMLCGIRYGWTFKEASALDQVKLCNQPMLFIHGDSDTFVPTEMVYRLYEAKPQPKELWITKGTEHALSYKNHPDEYIQRVREFCKKQF